MGITSALNTGLSGLASNQSQIDVVGNNIANVNTVSKSSRLDFKTQFLQNLSFGTAPSGDMGGTNPMQIGLGTQTGAITRNFGRGSLQVTGVDTNLAIQGDGFFILKDGTQQVYTRDGSFQLNGLNQLVSGTGQLLQGYGVDSSFSIDSSKLTALTIPINALTVAQASQTATAVGQFNATGIAASQVSDLTLGSSGTPQPFYLSNGAGGVNVVKVTPPAGTDLVDQHHGRHGHGVFSKRRCAEPHREDRECGDDQREHHWAHDCYADAYGHAGHDACGPAVVYERRFGNQYGHGGQREHCDYAGRDDSRDWEYGAAHGGWQSGAAE